MYYYKMNKQNITYIIILRNCLHSENNMLVKLRDRRELFGAS